MPTRQGWTAVVAAATSFASGRVFGLIELYVLGVGLLAVVAFATLDVQRRPPRLVSQRVLVPGVVQAGDEARVDLTVRNADQRNSPALELWEPVGGRGGAPMHLTALRPDEAATASYRIPTTTRGAIDVGPLRATRRDVLGLCRRTVEVPGDAQLLVVPFHEPVAFPTAGSGRLGEVLRVKAYGQTGNEFESLRDYVVGDDLRRVHWKASARSTGLIVRETAVEGVQRCTVVLDRDRGQYDLDGFERAVSVAASVVVGAAGTGLATRLVSTDADLRGPTVAQASLRWLATAAPAAAEGPTPSVPSLGTADGLGVMVVVTGTATSPLVRELRRRLGPDETVVTVGVHGVGGARGLVVDATTIEGFFDGWRALVSAPSTRPLAPAVGE